MVARPDHSLFPRCGAMSSSETKETRARTPAKYRRPELLDRIPTSPVTTPIFYAGAGAGVLVYGLVLAAVVSGQRAREATRPVETPHPVVALAPHDAQPAQDARPTPIEPPKPPPAPAVVPPKPSPPPPTVASEPGKVSKPAPAPEP